jgi:hypothetical protein
MKKKWLIIPMIALVCALCAGILVTGCPSEPDPAPPRIENPDFLFENGVFWYDFWDEETNAPTQRFRNGSTYEIILNLTELDDVLGGCHFQAQLFFTLPTAPDTDFLLAGSRNAAPSVIDSGKGKKYRFTLKIGDLEASGDDSKKTAEERAEEDGYVIPTPLEIPSSAPSAILGGMVRLKITLKTPNWYTVAKPWDKQEVIEVNAKDDWPGVDYYDPEITMGAMGEVIVRLSPDLEDYVPSPVSIKVNESVEITGKGSLGGDMFTTLAYAPADALLKVTFIAQVATGSNGGTSAAPGWGVIEFGNGGEQDKQRAQNINLAVNIPSKDPKTGETIVPTDAAVEMGPFVEYVYVEDILAACFPDDNWISVNVYNGARLTDYDSTKPGEAPGLVLMLKQ